MVAVEKPPLKSNQVIFNVLMIYYLLMLYAVSSLGNPDDASPFLYFFYTIPVVLWLILTIGSWLPQLGVLRRERVYAILFLVLVIVASLTRQDLTSVLNVALFILTILSIRFTRVKIKLAFVNRLFLASIVGAIISYHAGNSLLGYIPGQVEVYVGNGQSVSWRISLFPFVAESGFFSLLVLMVNFLFNKGKTKWVYCSLGLYFVVFTGMRSTFIALLFLIFFYLLSRKKGFKYNWFFASYNWVALLIFVVILNLNAIFIGLAGSLNSPVINQMLFRNKEGIEDVQELEKTIYRTWIWAKHLELFQGSPLVGIGTFDFEEVVQEKLDQNGTSGSESRLTGMIARYGSISLFFILFVNRLNIVALKEAKRFSFFLIFFFLLTMLTYASFLVPYNFMFLLIWGLFNGDGARDKFEYNEGAEKPLINHVLT